MARNLRSFSPEYAARESHNLRQQVSSKRRELVLQQLYSRAYEMNYRELAEDALSLLQARNLSFFRVCWRTRSEPAALERTLTGHTDQVSGVDATQDGRIAVSWAYAEETVIIWDLATGQQMWSLFQGESGRASKAVITPDEKLVVVAFENGSLSTWNLHSGQLRWSESAHDGRIFDVLVMDDEQVIVSASEDKSLKFWRLSDGTLIRKITLRHPITQLARVPVKGWVASISGFWEAGEIRFWDAGTGSIELALPGHGQWGIEDVAFSADGQVAATISYDDTVAFWDLDSAEQIASLQWDSGQHEDFSPQAKVAFLPKSTVLVYTADETGTLEAYDFAAAQHLPRLKGLWIEGGSPIVQALDESRVLFGGDDKIRVWNVAYNEIEAVLASHDQNVEDVALIEGSQKLVSVSADGTVKLWNIGATLNEKQPHGHQSRVEAIALTPDERYVVSASSADGIRVWNRESGQQEQHFGEREPDLERGRIEKLVVDERKVLLHESDRVLVYDLSSGVEECVVVRARGWAREIAIDVEDRLALVQSHEEYEKLELWDLRKCSLRQIVSGIVGRISTIALRGQWVNSLSDAGSLHVVDLASGGEVWQSTRLDTPSPDLLAVASDGQRAVSLIDTHDIRYKSFQTWDLERSCSPIREQECDSFSFSFARTFITPNLGRSVHYSVFGRLTVKDLETGDEKTIETGIERIADAAAISEEEIALIDSNGVIWLWNIISETHIALGEHTQAEEYAHDPQIIVAPGNKRIATKLDTSTSPPIRVWNLETRQCEASLDVDRFPALEEHAVPGKLALNPHGNILAYQDRTGAVAIVNIQENTSTRIRLDQRLTELSFSLEGDKIIFLMPAGIQIWDVATAQLERTIPYREDASKPNLSPNKRHCVFSTSVNLLTVWNLQTGERRERLITYTESRDANHFVRENSGIFIWSGDKITKADFVETSAIDGTDFFAPTGRWLSDSPTGLYAVYVVEERRLSLWNKQSGQEVVVISLDAAPECVTFTSDEKTIFIGDRTGNVYCLEYVEQ